MIHTTPIDPMGMGEAWFRYGSLNVTWERVRGGTLQMCLYPPDVDVPFRCRYIIQM